MPATEFNEVYKALEPIVNEARTVEGIKSGDDFYNIVHKAAFIKNYEFNLYASGLEEYAHSFYLTPTLRGMCEDIIVLKSIAAFDPQDKIKIITHIQMAGVFESLATQDHFFTANKPAQPVLKDKDAITKQEKQEEEIQDIYRKYGLLKGKQKWVKIKDLAISCGLLPVYEFFYSATSKWVHFSPQILLRMGWAKEKSNSATFVFSTKHFAGYYANFNFIYGSYLFVLFFHSLKNEIANAPAFEPHIKKLESLLDDVLQWPELVTYEEMTLEPPNPLVYGLLKVAEEEKTKGK
jgi:hypothetical protein